jgi:intracellular multiplication protein IcmE
MIEANSDTKGPIMAQISTGPFKGARLIGSFQTRQERYLTMKFNTMAHEDETYSINAVALDPNTTLSGMATEVDRRYFSRVVLPAAAEFLEGFGEAVAQTGSTTTNTGTGSTVQQEEDLDAEQELAKGFEEGAQEIGDVLDERADQIKPLIRVAAGTPIGVFFIEPVTSQSANSGGASSNAGNAFQQNGQDTNNQQSFGDEPSESRQKAGGEQLEQAGDNALNQLDFLQQLQNQ